jgi:hypothetical protein
MRTVAGAFWCLTAVAGSCLLAARLRHGGLRGQATRITVFPVALLFGHPLLALAGLACWAGYLVTGMAALAWLGFGLLCATVVLGFAMFTRWLVGRGGRHARGADERCWSRSSWC